jgi:hypothetical protein
VAFDRVLTYAVGASMQVNGGVPETVQAKGWNVKFQGKAVLTNRPANDGG